MVLLWEHNHLPEDLQARIAEPLNLVMGRSTLSGDALSLEMAADEICAALAEYPQAEEAFRGWFVTRYPIYTSG